jgi:glycerol-3-phosphate dehydrogenase (NAD(P)+)
MNKTATPKQQKTIAILGAGMWGKAIATLFKHNQHQVRLWSRSSPVSLGEVVQGTDLLISAVSTKGVTAIIERLQGLGIPENAIIVTATKGLEPQSLLTPSQLWQRAFPNHPIVVLSGPNLSKEIEQGLPAATVVASKQEEAAKKVQEILASESFRVYVNTDPLGTELGGTLKNVMAIAAGVCDGLQLGTNAKSALLTRALPEMVRVGTYLGADANTFFGLSGLGDLLTTCNSPLSRNYQVGYRLAQGQTLEQILAELEGTAEGINTTEVLIQIAEKQQIPVPIALEVHRLLGGETTPIQAVQALMERQLKAEIPEFDITPSKTPIQYS